MGLPAARPAGGDRLELGGHTRHTSYTPQTEPEARGLAHPSTNQAGRVRGCRSAYGGHGPPASRSARRTAAARSVPLARLRPARSFASLSRTVCRLHRASDLARPSLTLWKGRGASARRVGAARGALGRAIQAKGTALGVRARGGSKDAGLARSIAC